MFLSLLTLLLIFRHLILHIYYNVVFREIKGHMSHIVHIRLLLFIIFLKFL